MPGASSQEAINSYLAFFQESSWGEALPTAATGATAMEFLTASLRTEIDSEKLDTIGKRGFTKRVQLNKRVEGKLEGYLHPHESPLMFACALMGGISSASISGGFVHSIAAAANAITTPNSIAINHKKGSTVFGYNGGRINKMTLAANVGEVVKISYEMIFKDSTSGISDIASSLSYSSALPYTFVQGTYRYAENESAADTTGAEEPITGFELSVNNNLKADTGSRQLGTNILSVLPPTRRDIEFKVMQRFDTLTVYNRFLQATQGAVELKFSGASLSADENFEAVIRLPKVFVNTPDPEVAGSQDILMSEILFDAVMDTTGSGGRDIGVTFKNDVSSY